MWAPEPLPMVGQLWVEPVPDPELEPEPEDVPEEPELALDDPEFPALVLDEGVLVDELEVELVPELPVVVEVVAALATSAPPVTSPVVSALMASTLRRRICMGGCPFISCEAPTRSGRCRTRCAPDLWAGAQPRGRLRGVA